LDGLVQVGRLEAVQAGGEKVGVVSATIGRDPVPSTDDLLASALRLVDDRVGTGAQHPGTFRTFLSVTETAQFADAPTSLLATAFATTSHVYVLYVVGPTADTAALEHLESTFST
jgi:hypothetical protein